MRLYVNRLLAGLWLSVSLLFTGCDPGGSGANPSVDSYPNRNVTVICPWSPGGGTDRVARYWAAALEKEFGSPFVVVNRTGGNGAVGHNAGAHARPNGNTLTVITFELCTMHRLGVTTVTYKDFECLLQFNADPAAIIVRADAPWKSIQEFLDDAANRSEDKLKLSGTAPGAAWDLARIGLLRAAGLAADSTIWVPSEGAAPSLVELLGGHVDAVCCSVPEAAPQVEAGQLRVLAVMAEERLPQFDDVPTVRELGYDWVAVGWRGLALPRNTPAAIIELLQEKCTEIAKSAEFKEFMDKNGFGIEIRATAEFEQFLEQQDAQWGNVIEAADFGKP